MVILAPHSLLAALIVPAIYVISRHSERGL